MGLGRILRAVLRGLRTQSRLWGQGGGWGDRERVGECLAGGWDLLNLVVCSYVGRAVGRVWSCGRALVVCLLGMAFLKPQH